MQTSPEHLQLQDPSGAARSSTGTGPKKSLPLLRDLTILCCKSQHAICHFSHAEVQLLPVENQCYHMGYFISFGSNKRELLACGCQLGSSWALRTAAARGKAVPCCAEFSSTTQAHAPVGQGAHWKQKVDHLSRRAALWLILTCVSSHRCCSFMVCLPSSHERFRVSCFAYQRCHACCCFFFFFFP